MVNTQRTGFFVKQYIIDLLTYIAFDVS